MTVSRQLAPDDAILHQHLFEHAGVGLLVIAFDGIIRQINPNGAEFLGRSRTALIGTNVLEVTHPDDIGRTVEALTSVIQGQTHTAVLEKRYLRSDGQVVWSRSRVSLLPGHGAPADSVIAVVADITELKHAQRDLEELNRALQATLEGGLLGLGIALEARDLETSGHTVRVMDLSQHLAEELGLNPVMLNELRHGASLHDLGKLTIPDAVLGKPGRLDADEWALMQTHAHNGYAIASRIPTLARAALDVIRHHHERWDGTGYPDRLVGEAIPLLARIFAVCDVYDALTSERPYKSAWTHEAAVEELRAQRGRQFDPRVIDAFLSSFSDRAKLEKVTQPFRGDYSNSSGQ